MVERLTKQLIDGFWRVTPGWWIFIVLLVIYIAGVTDPTCCVPGVYDDFEQYHRW